MAGRAKTRVSFGITGRVLAIFAICASSLLAAAAYGFWQYQLVLRSFSEDVMSSQTDAIDVEAIEISFKKQVQEWKDTLLRGKQPEALAKHWSAFQARERDVRDLAERLSRRLRDRQAADLVSEFVSAHARMGDAYRRGLQEYGK